MQQNTLQFVNTCQPWNIFSVCSKHLFSLCLLFFSSFLTQHHLLTYFCSNSNPNPPHPHLETHTQPNGERSSLSFLNM